VSQLKQDLLSSDLDHIIDQRSSPLTGVLPASIASLEFIATCSETDEDREIEVNGIYINANTEYSLNATKYATLPSIGSILEDASGRQVKVLALQYDDENDPVQLTLTCNRRFSNQ